MVVSFIGCRNGRIKKQQQNKKQTNKNKTKYKAKQKLTKINSVRVYRVHLDKESSTRSDNVVRCIC